MNWAGKSSVFLVTVMAIVLTGLFGATAQAEVLRPAVGEESAFFYPSFPLEGGPYITAASLWNGAGSADSLIVVFSEAIDSTEVTLDDFVLDGFTATAIHRTGLPSRKYIVIDGIAGVTAGTDSIGLIWGSVEGVDGSVSKDIGLVPVTQGPVVVDVTYDQSYSASAVEGPFNANQPGFEVFFDHPVGIASGQAASIFKVTPELSGTLLTNTVNAATASISIARNPAAGSDSLLWMHPGIAKMWVDVDDVYWTGLNAIRNVAQKTVVRNQGPALMAAYYNDMNTHVGADNLADDEIWLVFDQPVPPTSLQAVASQYVPGWAASFDVAAQQARQPSGADYANVIVVTNPLVNTMVSPTNPAEQYIREAANFHHVDYQGVVGPGRMARCRPGVGIIRAVYFDRETDNPADDQLHIWFNEELDVADVTTLDFVITPWIADWQSEVDITVENINALGHVVISGWDNVTALAGTRLPGGFFVRMRTDAAFDGLDTQSGCDGTSLIPIFDDSKPGRISLDEVPWLTYKRYNVDTQADTCFLAWQETGATDDSDDYFLFFTNQAGTPLDDLFIQNYRHNAKAVGNFRVWTVDGQVQRCALDITQGELTTDGHAVAHGDELRFMLVPGRYWGTFADGDGDAVLKFGTTIIAGPICPPQDFDDNDDDIIHVTAVAQVVPEGDDPSWTRSIFGDANAAPCGSWVYIFDRCWEGEPGVAVELGRGEINANKSFDAIELDDSVVDPDTLETLYIYAWDDGAWSVCLGIRNDVAMPGFALDDGAIPDADRFNPFRIYKADDYVNILLLAWDSHVVQGKGDYSLSDLLEITADFSHVDNRTTLPAALGSHPVNAVPLVSMGNDEVDNDGDWIANDPNIDIDDDGEMDFPEPYVDENQDGSFDPGETFVDKDDDDLCDCVGGTGDDYDLNLDSADPDEHAVYEIRLLAAGDADLYNDVVKGFPVTDPVTDPTGMTNFGEIKDIPVPFTVTDTYLDMTTVYAEDEAPFTCEMDEVPPTVAEVTELYSLGTYTEASVLADNLIVPTDPVYNLGRFFNFKVETQSDDDVLFGTVQIKEHASATWDELTLDPPGWNANPTYPGVEGFDDDRDYTVPADTDEDGDIDDSDGIDLSDAQVVDAAQDSTADADADAGDGVYRVTDRRDNDNDAFFIFEPYYDVDGGLGSSQLTQKVVWFNIDERTDNDIDDNFDGSVDNASEVETYSAQGDDNEDGILDGEAVELTAYGINPLKDVDAGRFFCVFDSTYDGPFYVDASHVEGEHPADRDNDIRALTEFIPFSYGVLDANGDVDTDGPLPDLPWGDDSVNPNYPGATLLAWYGLHSNTNIDFWHIAQILYGVIPDGTQQYDVRMVAYDQPGNVNPDWAVPFTFTSDVTPPEVWLTGCPTDGLPADFGNGVICPTGAFTLTVENTTDVTKVYFERRISTDEGATWTPWGAIGSDESLPFTAEWQAAEATPGDVPPDAYVLVEFRAYAEDDFGNVQDADSACVAQVRVQDCEAPTTWFTRIFTTDNTAGVGDHMEIGDLPNPYYYRDVIGPLQVPRGPAIDIWALFTPYQSPDSVATLTHDVIRVVFEISLAGSGIWTPFATVTGSVNPDDSTIDLTLPVAVTLETEALETGTYDIRVYSCDIEGNNCPDEGAPSVQYDIAKITVVEEGLRAYIQPVHVDCTEMQKRAGYELYAINWIHDYFINKVLFQYYGDTNGDGIDNDGNDWVDIATDDGTSGDPRGDIVLRRGMELIEDLTGRVGFDSADDSLETYIDYDNDGYSERDPIILDANADLMFDISDGDNVVLGDLAEIMSEGVFALTKFAATEFHTGAGRFDPTEWIFAENQSGIAPAQATGTLNLWSVNWDVTGIEQGTFLVRAVATDDMYAVDDTTTSPSVIPTEPVSIDVIAPTAVIAEVTTPDDVTQTAINDLYFPGETGWLKICATSPDTDLSNVKIQFRIPGHDSLGNWNDLDVNDDEDFFVDIDGVPGFSAGDEVYLDAGTVPYVWDAGDILLYAGSNGHADAPGMATPPALIPLFNYEFAGADSMYEELDNSTDDDHDGMVDEDLLNAEDWFAPYCIYFPITALGLISDTNVEFRAVATDQSCNTDESPVVVRFMIGETVTPEADVVWVKLSNGSEIDYLPEISDGDCATQLTAADIMEPLTLLVTAEDATAITQVDLKFRRSSSCYGLEEWNNPWLSMSAEGFILSAAPDENYDFLMTVDLEALAAEYGSGIYEFYPEAKDNEGNFTPVQVNPYLFDIMLNEATITTAMGGTVAPGDEFWFAADLAYADASATVHFKYAERLLDVAIDATRITPDAEHATYQTLPLDIAMYDPSTNAVLTIDGVAGTYFETADELMASGGPGDWTYDGSAQSIEFSVQPASDAVVLVSYNINDYAYIWDDGPTESTDNEAPYTAAWDAAEGHNVPFPENPATDAYDFIAVVTLGGEASCCGQYEAELSEGKILILEDELAPNVRLYGGGLWYKPAPDVAYWPGNPSFPTVAGLTEWKLSGLEHQFFATSDSSDVASMDLVFTGYGTDDVTTVPMTLYGVGAETIPMTFTLYQTDFPEVPYDWENVTLQLDGQPYAMAETVAGNGIWQVVAPVQIGVETTYAFDIDQVGNDFLTVQDPRNKVYVTPGAPAGDIISVPAYWKSTVKVPAAPLWFADAPSFGTATTVWQVQAKATDSTGNAGTGHLYTFVYDPVAPTIDEVTADAVRFGFDDEVTVTAIVTDQETRGYDFNVITVKQILVQYCPNFGAPEADRVWLAWGTDTDAADGWAVESDIDLSPAADGFDNDGDGEWDEADEATSAMAWRVFAMDDGNNWGPPVVLPFTLDDTPPVAALTTPVNGDVFPYGTTIELAATITDTEEDIAYVLFQYNAGDGWEDVDITPEDNTDHPFDTTAPYAVNFNTTDYLDEADTYVRFRAVAVDRAGNEDPEPMEVLVVVNDITGPTAFAMWAKTTGAADYTPLSDPRLAVNGHGVMIKGVAVDPSGRENLAWVRVQYQLADTDTWTDIAIVPSDVFVLTGYNDFTVGWSVSWDVIPVAEGLYNIRAIAADIDGNQDPNPIAGSLRIDHTRPEVLYEPIAGLYEGFAPYAAYQNDGAPGSSNAFTPDPATGDILFTVITRSSDIEGVILQGHQAGIDDLGEWIDAPSGYFDFESNLTFQHGGETYYVWRLALDDGRDYAEVFGISGVYEVRALATDFAGNSNILHDALNNWKTWTVDVDDPVMLDLHSTLGAESDVVSGGDVTFTAVMTDSTTDVATVRFEYSLDTGNVWTVIDPNPATEEIEAVTLIPENIDTPFARWTGVATWTTPYPVVEDTDYVVRAVFYDTAGNMTESNTVPVTVEDNIKPEFTKIWAIPATVNWVDDTYYESADGAYNADCENQNQDGLYIDMNGNGVYNAGTDIAIDYGFLTPDGYTLLDGTGGAGKTIGSPTNTWPRYIDEIVLGGTLPKSVSHEVTLVGRTQIDDTGLERVEFYAVNTATSERILVGTDECPPAYAQWNYLWHIRWNTLATDEHGDPIYPDGEYTIVPIAYDLEGNVEEWGRDMSGAATVTVDNTAPEAITTLVPATVERNDMLILLAETDVPGLQDDAVEFYFKRSTDLNMAASWLTVEDEDGVDETDDNPDYTRPYSFDWDLDKMDVPFPLEDPIVGLTYHVAASSWDILGNTRDELAAFAAGDYATFTVVDTKAPIATITEIARSTGDTDPISMPHLMGPIHARDLDYLTAKILGFENDTEKVEFMWAEVGQDPMLIDAQVVKDPNDPYTWQITDWDLRPLAGKTIEVFAVGYDDVGNYDVEAERDLAFTLVVDYAAPVVDVVTPFDGMKACRVDSENRYYNLIFTSPDADVDLDAIQWEYKLSSDVDAPENWNKCVLTAPGIVWDVNSETFAAAWDVLADSSEVLLLASNIYDVRLTVYDVAGNVYTTAAVPNGDAELVVIDVDEPWGEITRVDVAGESYYPTLPIDITRGDTIDLWATASDIEEGLPLGTGVKEIIFQVLGSEYQSKATGLGDVDGAWRDIGFWQAPTGTTFEEVEASVTWNTSGEPEDTYYVRIKVTDDECNTYESGNVTLVITDQEPPRARIAGFDPWQIPHGDNRTTYCDVYAVAYSDTMIEEVQFQYSTNGTEWIPFGITEHIDPSVPSEHSDWGPEMCDLWYATLDLSSFSVDQQVWFRAIANDDANNHDPLPPTVLTQMMRYEDGSLDLVAVDNLPDLADMSLILEGGEDPDDFIVHVDMGRADQRPYVLYLPPTPVGQGGQPWCVEMIRMIDTEFSTAWQGAVEWIWDDCGKSTIFAGALSDENEIDLHVQHVWSWDVDYVLGSNGTAHVPGYVAVDDTPLVIDYLYATATVPSASGGSDEGGCLLLSPSVVPGLTPDDARYLQMVPRTGYAMGWIEDENHEPTPGYPWTLSIQYDEAGLQAAAAQAGVDWAEVEPYLTVRAYNWYDSPDFGNLGWTGSDISNVTVDAQTNTVSFNVSAWCYMRPHFALFVPKWDAPVVVRSFTPWSPYAGRWNYTDVDPKILIDLNGTGVEPIDPYTIEVYIDGNQVAANLIGGDWAEGNGDLDVQQKNFEQTRYQVYYQHSTNRAWWLTEGMHTLNVMYKHLNGPEDWVSLPANAPGATFWVDNTAPYVEFHGGWIDNPLLRNVAGYLNPFHQENMLTVRMYDAGAGILVRPEHLYPLFGSEGGSDSVTWHDDVIDNDQVIGDPGIKYDLWLVHDEDDQTEVDEIEERLLLHTGTADEIIPYITPPLFATTGGYEPSDTMEVRLPIVAGGRTHDIQDGDIIEVTLYTKKHIEHMDDFEAGCDASIILNYDPETGFTDTLATIALDCYYDRLTGLHVYDRGIYDWAGNSGSAYVEQRFIVDMSAPTATLVYPIKGWVAPGEDFDFEIWVQDGGSGVASASAKLLGPDGSEITNGVTIQVNGDRITGHVIGGLPAGTYTAVVTVTDQAGNTGTVSVPIVVEAAALALYDAYVSPNPSNPDDSEAMINFTLSRHADVSIKVYDFAGEYVSTVLSNHSYTGAGHYSWPWAGQGADGTALANGAYIIRIEAQDGSAKKTANVKAVIWRE